MVATHDKEEIRIFLDELEEGLSYLDEAIISLEENPKHQETLEEIFRVAHTIKGSAGFLDLKNLVALGHAMENVFQEFKSGTIPVTTNVINTVLECKDAIGEIGQLLGKGEDTSKINTDHLIEKINGFLAGKSAPPSPAAKSASATTETTGPEFTAADYVPGTFMVRVWISQNEMAPSIRAFLINKRLSEYGEIARQSPSEEEMDDENFVMPESREIRYWIKTDKTKEEIEDAAKVDLVDNVGIISEEFLKEISEASPVEQVEEPGRIRADVDTSESVRIPVSRLDTMLNLVGELVIANSGFMQIQDTLRALPELDSVFKDVRDRTKELTRISGEIQGLVMNSRLVPISQVFNRFKRFVRDYSTQSGKKIRMTMSGESTELDKKITDEIIKPMTHLVRNSLDHGLETPEERLKTGKPETGTLHLEAYQEGNYINIIILDDGRGINTEKILQKGINSGIITSEQAMTMSEEEIRDLIFHSGFSTKEEIDEMSGRGVGMDVVKTSVEDLNGTLILDSEPGKGTRITIKLPLTLAILNALIVRVGKEKFCIPMSSIVETQKVSENNFLTVDNNEMVRLREKLIPVIRLDKIFPPELDETPETKVPEKSKTIFLQKKDNLMKEFPVIVVDYMESPIAILVDQFLNRQEVVIKSLAEHYRTIDGISGASILGDGSIILIIDVHGVIQLFRSQKLKIGIDLSIAKSIAKQQIKPIRKPPMPAPVSPAAAPAPAAPAPPVVAAPSPEPMIEAAAPVEKAPVISETTPEAPNIIQKTSAARKPEINLSEITAMTPDEFEMLEDLELPPAEKPSSEEMEGSKESEPVEPGEEPLAEEFPEPEEPVEESPAEEMTEETTESEEIHPHEASIKEIKHIIKDEIATEEAESRDQNLEPVIETFDEAVEKDSEDTIPQKIEITDVEDNLESNPVWDEEEPDDQHHIPPEGLEGIMAEKTIHITDVEDREAQPLSPFEPKETEETVPAPETEQTSESETIDELESLSAENFFDEGEETPAPEEPASLEEMPPVEEPAEISEEEDIEISVTDDEQEEELEAESTPESFEFSVSEDDSVTMVSDQSIPEEPLTAEEQRLETPPEQYQEINDEISINDINIEEIEVEMDEMENLGSEEPQEEPHEEAHEKLKEEPIDESVEVPKEATPSEELTEFERMKQLIESGQFTEDELTHDSIALDHFNKEDHDLTKLNAILEGQDQELVKTWLKAGNQHAIEGIKSLTGHDNIYPGQTRAKKYTAEKLQSYIDRFKNDDYPVIGLTLPMLPIKGMIYFVLTHNNARNMAAMLYQTAQMPTPETIDFEPLMEVTNILGSAFTNSLTQITDIPIEPGIPQILENNELLVDAMDQHLKDIKNSNILYIENEFLWGEKEVLAELVLMIPKIL